MSEVTALKDRLSMVRGNQGFGRKPSRGALAQMAAYEPVDIHHYDDATGETTIETIHDPNPVIDANVAFQNSGHDGFTPSRDFKHVARIPNGEVVKLFAMGLNPYRNEDWPRIAAMLDSPDWKKWRTGGGKISRRPFREYLGARIRRR